MTTPGRPARHGDLSPAHADRADWSRLLFAASDPYRRAGRFAWLFARNKLAHDPVFRHLLQAGLVAPRARVLDLGCGQGLLASLLHHCNMIAAAGHWPRGWAAAPVGTQVTGIELMQRDVTRAQAALGEAARFLCADMRRAPWPEADAVVMLDVLHYIDEPAQDALLARVRDSLSPGGSLLLRVADAGSRRGLLASQAIDRIVALFRGHRVMPQFCRTQDAWRARLEALGFDVRSEPMSQGTPFANVLLVARMTPATRHPSPPMKTPA